jgi:hypothetical protein
LIDKHTEIVIFEENTEILESFSLHLDVVILYQLAEAIYQLYEFGRLRRLYSGLMSLNPFSNIFHSVQAGVPVAGIYCCDQLFEFLH